VEHGRAIREANIKAERNREVGFGSRAVAATMFGARPIFAALRESAKSGRKGT
jgi:hypothetical protein